MKIRKSVIFADNRVMIFNVRFTLDIEIENKTMQYAL